MYPDVLSYDKIVELTGSFKVPMGCRSFLQGWKDENGVEVNSGRMNLGVVTVNLPRIALESGGDKEKFWQIFNERMNIAEDALVYRVERTKEATPANAPILYQYGAFGKRLGKYDQVDQLFRHRRATVSLGYIGLYEVATVFYGPNWEHNPEAKQFTIDIIKDMKARVEEWSDQYDYHFSIYSTPSESLTDRFCRLDTEKFGKVRISQTRNTTPIVSTTMFVRTQHHLKSWILKKFILKLGRLVALSTIVNTLCSNKIQKPLKRFGIMLMTGSVISEPIRRLTVVTSVILKEISRRLSADLLVQTVAIAIRKRLMWSNGPVVISETRKLVPWSMAVIRKSRRVSNT